MTYRVMVVEDDACHRDALVGHLSDRGYEAMGVESAEQALSRLKEFGPELVISDIRLPELDGFAILDRVRKHAGSTDVILMTGFDDVQVTIDAMKRGAFDYLAKPLDLDRFDSVIERWARLRSLASEREDAEGDGGKLREARWGPIGTDPQMREIYKIIGTVAPAPTPVLITGETGTGKELIARTIHWNGSFPDQPFVAVNCAAIPETLLESELFGHVKGAFTGASSDRKGRFELAGRGTLFLDEIGDTSMAFQAKLLRVLQEREFQPVGGEKTRTTHARIVAATNRDLPRCIEEGEFREDLYFRLRVIELHLPPLRERRGDIPLLVNYMLEKVARELAQPVPFVPGAVMEALTEHEWPGNVRELENAVTRAALLARGGVLSIDDLGLGAHPLAGTGFDHMDSLETVERLHVQRVLSATEGDRGEAARILEISPPDLDRLIEKFDGSS